MRTLLLVLSLVPALALLQDAPTLQSLRDKHRVLLLFAPSQHNPTFVAQSAILSEHQADLADRDLVTLPQIAAEPTVAQTAIRKRFHIAPADFTIILIGKDGGEKLRRSSPISIAELNSTIDAMPMRQDEMRNHRH